MQIAIRLASVVARARMLEPQMAAAVTLATDVSALAAIVRIGGSLEQPQAMALGGFGVRPNGGFP